MSQRLAEALRLLPEYLGSHLSLVVIALLFGIGISLPLAILATRWRWLRGPLLTVTGVLQTIPSLALLALMVPLLGRIGFLPALYALILYSMLPIVRNTITGIEEVSPDLVEAAQGLGFTDLQLLLRVQLPLAAPVILAGIRTATVWVVGVATLSTPVGATSLGNFIFSGLQTQNMVFVLVGVVAAAALAVLLDLMILLLELSARRRNPVLGISGVVLLLGFLVATLLPGWLASRSSDGTITIGTKTFTEQYVLAEWIGSRLKEAGYEVESVESLGSTVVFDALAQGNIDLYVDYSGTLWANQMHREDNPGPDSVLAELTRWLREEVGVTLLGPLGFENAYVFAMQKDRAQQLGVETTADLARVAGRLSVGGDYEFFDRPEWTAVREAYGLEFRQLRRFDSSLMYPAVRDGLVDVIGAFSTDGRIDAFGLVTLPDPMGAFPPYDAVLLLSKEAARDKKLVRTLTPLIGSLTNTAMRRANGLVDLEGETISAASDSLSRWSR